MYVETWSHLSTVLNNIKPLLSPSDKQTCNQVISWGIQQGNNYFDINVEERSVVWVWLGGLQSQFTGQSKIDVINAGSFLLTLNTNKPAEYWHTIDGCSAHGYYFYDGFSYRDKAATSGCWGSGSEFAGGAGGPDSRR